MAVRKKKASVKKLPRLAEIENARGTGAGLVLCDHASNRVPAEFDGLGLPKSELQRHIAYDIGTDAIGRRLAKQLRMPAMLARYTRLVVDLNRAPTHRECVPRTSDHTKIPANSKLSAAERKKRLARYFDPYHAEVEKRMDALVRKHKLPVLIAVHSFTPEMDGVKRHWHIGILWNREENIGRRLVAEIRKNNPEVLVGENEPYSLKNERFPGSTVWRHAEARGLPSIVVEFRQDLVDTPAGARKWCDLFYRALKPVLAELQDLHKA